MSGFPVGALLIFYGSALRKGRKGEDNREKLLIWRVLNSGEFGELFDFRFLITGGQFVLQRDSWETRVFLCHLQGL